MDDKISKLYQAFVNEGYSMEPEDQFRQNLSDPAKRKAAYDALVSDGYNMEPFAEFETNIGFGKVEQAPAQTPTTNQAPEPQPTPTPSIPPAPTRLTYPTAPAPYLSNDKMYGPEMPTAADDEQPVEDAVPPLAWKPTEQQRIRIASDFAQVDAGMERMQASADRFNRFMAQFMPKERRQRKTEVAKKEVLTEASAGLDQLKARLSDAEGRLKELMQQREEEGQAASERPMSFLERLGASAAAANAGLHPTGAGAGLDKSPLDKSIEEASAEVMKLQQTISDYESRAGAADKSWLGKVGRGLASGITSPNTWTMGVAGASIAYAAHNADPSTESGRQLLESHIQAEELAAQSPDAGGFYEGGRFVGEMIGDPVTYASLGVGAAAKSVVTKGAAKVIGKGMAKDVAERYTANTLAGRLATRYGTAAAASGANFGTFEGLRDLRQQAMDGGYTDEEGNFHEGVSLNHAIREGGHGLIMGTTMGIFGAGMGNVGEIVVKGINSAAGKAATRAAQHAVSVVGEGTIFAAPEIYDFQTMDDAKFDAQYAQHFGYAEVTDPKARAEARDAARNSLSWDAWGQSQANIAGMKIAGAMTHPAATVGHVKSVLDNLRTTDRRDHRSLGERIKAMTDRSPFDIAFTKDEAQEIRDAGYGDLANLFMRKGTGLVKAEDAGAGTSGYETVERLMEDPTVSEAARAKAYYVLTGHMLPMSTVTGYSTVENPDGRITVQSTNARGGVVTSRSFKDRKDAEREVSAIQRQAELNTVEVGENFREAAANDAIFTAAVRRVSPGADPETVKQIYRDVRNGREGMTEDQQALADMIDNAIDFNDGADMRPDAIRRSIKDETGVDVDAALRKSANKRSEEEAEAVSTYMERLFDGAKLEEGQTSNPSAPGTPGDGAYQEGIQLYKRLSEAAETGDEQARGEAQADIDAIGLRMKEAYEAIEDAFGPDAEIRMAEMEDDPWALVNDPTLTVDQQDAVLYFINSKAAMDGVADAALESAERKRAEAAENIKRRTHRDSGMVQPAIMKIGDRQVYIAKGNVMMLDDGSSVDVANSDNSIIVFDPTTGEYEFTSPDRIFSAGEAIDPQTELTAANEAIDAEQTAIFNQQPIEEQPVEQPATEDVPETPLPNVPAEVVPKSDESAPAEAETTVEGSETAPEAVSTGQTALSRVPLNEEGEPSFEAVDKDTAWDALVEVAGADAAAADIALAQTKSASEGLEALKGKKPTMKAPKLKGSPMAMARAQREATEKYQAELDTYNQQIDDAQARFDAWSGIVGVYNTRSAEQRKQRQAEQEAADAQAHDEAVARFEEQQRVEAEKQAEQERVGTHAVNPKIKAKWDAANKIDGAPDAITLPDGSIMRGRYTLTEAGAASPSHDVINAYQPTEGFPVDANGQSVNDRDYMRDKEAQGIVERMAVAYDNRALQTPVIVSKDGVVLSGNNRTMSGDLAAQQGTDKAYVDYLREFGGKYGFTPEQVDGMKNPRVVFVPDEELPYDATTFSRFNAQEMKSQSKPEAAVKLGKIVPDEVFAGIVNDISRYDRLSDYYADEKAVAQALGALMQAGVINDKQMPELRTGTALSATGKELIENTLIGKVFQASPDAVRQIISIPSLRQPIVMGLNEVANNRALADADYDISKELAQAIDLVTRAKSAMPDIYTDGMPVSPFGRMQGLFDDEFGDSALTDGVALQLADVLNSGRPSDLRKWLSVYNHQAAEAANGQIDMFTGAVASKEDILTQVKEHFTNATPKEQQALINAAIAGRKQRSAEAAGQSGRGQANEQTADGAPGNSESQRVEPTEAQKAAGNYKKEHRRIDGYDISIENAKGSVRSGKDAGGKKWSITMHNDYGYIRGTEGVDGDHIDVFLSDTPKEGDVFVVDQVNKDGSFDEHKVMYGFPTKEAAREAYLSNYEEGWTGLGAITHVSRDEFKKWIASSHRKTKPFAEYKSIKVIEGNGMIGRSLTGQEATELIKRMEATAEVAPTIELTPENWIAQFGEDGTVETPIGIVRMGANQLLKLYSTKRTGYFGMIHPTLSTPDAIFEEADPKEGSERDSKYLFVKTFVKSDGSRIVHFESVTVKKDGMEVSISSHEIKDKSLKNKMQNDIVLHLDEKLSPSSEMRLTEAPSESEGPDLVPTSDNVISSDRKDNTLSSDKQVVDEERSIYSITPTTYTNKANKTSDVYLVKFNRELSKEEKAALDTFARGLLTEGKKISRGWWDRKHGGYMMRSEETARQLAEMVGNEETIADAQPLSREDFTAEPRKKAPKAPNTVTTKELAEAEAPKEAPAKGKFVVTDEMKAQEDELRKLLGIDDDEGSRDTYFRDPDELTPAQKRAVFKLGVEYAFNFLDNGVTSFPDFALAVVGRLGAKVKPFIKSWYEGAKRVPGYGGEGYTETAEVDAFDIENFDKPTPDAIRDAAMRVAERKVAQAAEQAEKELIQDRNTNRKDHDKETETATATLAEKAEAIAGEAEAVASAASTGHAGRGELQQAIERVDEALDAINDQLALLGYYEAVKDESKYHESYGYMLTAEKKAVTDAANLAKQLVSDLGIDLKVTSATTPLGRKNVKKGTAVRANIAPAGGDVTIRLPLNEGRELAIYIGLFPVAEKGSHREGDNLTVERILYRVENPNGRGMERYGHNRYAPVESTYADLLRSIKQAARDYLPEPPAEKPTVHDNAVEMLSEGKKPSKKKATKVDEQQLIGDLFSTTFDNPNTTNANGKPRTEDSGSQRVAETERPNPVGDDAPRADGGIQPSTADGTRDVGSAPAESEAGRAGTDGATHGPDEERGVQRPVGDRGRDESATDRGSDRSDMERRGTTRPSADAGQEPDAGAERVPEREPAAAPGEGSRPTPVKKPQLPSPEVKYTRNFRYGAQGNEADSYTPAQRLEGNVSAIETLVDILFSGDPATDEQKAILSRFRGWGQVDLTNVYSLDFMERSDNRTLRRLAAAIKKLDPQNEKKLFEAIKRASLSAFYTPTKVAAAMNSFLPLAGFRGGNFLDPSMGNGIFEGTMPKEVQERTSITGVELDWLSGQISRALYPDAQIHIGGFEKSGLQPGSFDVVSTNVPFGQYGVNDPTWQADASPIKRAAQNRIHNYFAVKMLEETRPGGLVSMMTTPAIMDTKGNQNIRAHIADQGEILGAIRLPDNTFQGTGAVADIIFIRKWRDEDDRMTTRSNPEYQELEQSFLSLHETTAPNKVNGSKQKVSHNAYFVKNRKNMIGDIQAGNQYSQEGFGLTSKLSTDEIASEVEKAVKRIVGKRKGELYNPARSVREVRQAVREAFKGDADWVGNGNLVVQDGKVGVLNARSNEYGEVTREFEGTLKHDRIIPRVEAMTSVRTAMKKLIAAQIEGERDATLDKLRSELKTAYDAFVGRYGRLQDNGNAFILDDIDGYTMQALEVWKNGKFAGLSDIFTKNTIKPALRLDGAKTPQEAITTSLAEYGYVRPGYMAKSVGKDWAEKCGDLIFLTPNSADDYVTRDEYLSGDVVTKLNQAREAAKRNPKFEANVKALEEVQPATIPFDDIAAHLGARWIPSDVLTDFVTEVLGLHAASNRRGKWVDGQWVTPLKSGVVYVPELDSFQITIDPKELGGSADDWSTAKKSAKEILQAALEDKTVVIKNRDSEGNETVDEEQTELANQKIADLRDKFEEWLPGDPNRVELIERAYNDRFNRTVIRKFDGSHLVVPGLMGKELRPHQKDAVWMLINNRGGIVDHIVGAGKTLVMQSAIMEMRRMGIAKKPMIVALKSTVSQIAREFKEAFPSARVLAPNDSDFQKANRKKFIANISLNDYDCVILSHEQYCMLPHTEEAERDVINEQLWQLDNMIEYLYGAEDQSQMTKRQIKALEKRRENLIAKLEKRLDRNVDREFCFENLGVDYLFVDECHQFKSLPYVTSYNRVAGLGDTDGSSRAVALLTGVRHLQKMHQGDKGTIFLSGTTITNSLVEIYNLLNYLRPRELQRLGMPTFDAWASTFAVHSSELEAGTTGTFATKDRFRSFDNVPELSALYAEIADVRNDQNLKLPKPGIHSETHIVPASAQMEEINREIVYMLNNKDGKYFGIYPKDPSKAPWGLHASTISAKAAVSPRLVFPDWEDQGGKVHAMCEQVSRFYKDGSEYKGVQLIFCEMGVPGKDKKYDAYNDIRDRLANDYGIPRKEIAFIQEAPTEEKRKELFQNVRDGKIRILIGGTKNMGTGVNVQDRITDMHMLTVPWTPSALEQCIGRGGRQGNIIARDFLGNKVRVHYYATEGSLDLYKYQLLDAKGKMFTQFKMGTVSSGNRSFDEGSADEDGNMDPAEMVAILSGNPVIFEKAKQEKLVKKLRNLRNGFEREYQRKKSKLNELTTNKEKLGHLIRLNEADRKTIEKEGFVPDEKGAYSPKVIVRDGGAYYGGRTFDKPKEAGQYIHKLLEEGKQVWLCGYGKQAKIVTVNEEKDGLFAAHREVEMGDWRYEIVYRVPLSDDDTAAGTAFRNLMLKVINNGDFYKRSLADVEAQLSGLNIGDGTFPKQKELDEAQAKLKELTAEYNKLGKSESNSGDTSKTRFRLVEAGPELDFLNSQPLKIGYRYAQWANMGVLPPMTAKRDGKWREPMIFGAWERSEEGMRNANGKADLVQGNGRTTGGVAYNPYFHIRTSPINDQFSGAFDRPELLVIQGYYPESEETSGYRAEGAKDPVGLMNWHSGSVNGQLSPETKVQTMLSRYFKPIRIVPWSEVADLIMERIGEQKITFPINAVPPMLRYELAKRGAKFGPVSGTVAKEDLKALNDIQQRINAGEYDAGLEKARSYMDAYESSNEAKAARAEYLSANLGVPVKVISDEPDMAALPSNRHRRAKGWWSEGEGIVVALPNNVNVADVDNTVVHEMVGHYGLRKLVGTDRFDNFLDEVYNHASDAVRAKIDAMEEKIFNGEADKMRRAKSAEREQAGEDINAHFVGDTAEAYAEAHKHRQAYRREATEEYMSDLAGRVGSEGFAKMEEEELNIWGKIKAAVQRLLDNFLKRLNIPKSIKLTDRHFQYILYKSWRNLKDRHIDKADVFSQAEDAMMRARTGYNDVERFRDGDMSLEETIIKMKTEAAQANADNWKVKRDAMKAIGGNLNHLRQAMARQREYDLTTVKSITDLAKILLDNNMLDDLSKYETKRLLSTVNNVLGRQDVSKYVQKVMDIMVDNQLRLGANALGHLLSIRDKRVDARGIEVQGELDPEGQMISQAMRKSMSLPKDAIEMKIAEAVNLMGSPDAAVADQAAIEYSALLMAHQYVEDITESKAEEKELRASIHEAKADKDAGKITAQAYSQYVEATEDAIRQNKIERAEAYRDIVERIGGVLGESVGRAKAWREAEKARVEEIHHNANSDMEGRPTDEHHKNNRAQNLANNSGVRFLLAPLATFDQMLRMFGRKNSRGEGYLWNRYMRGWVDATEREYLGYKSALKTLDEKVKEIFKDSKDYKANSWGDLFSVDRKLPKASVRFWDGGEMKEHELTQGNLLYIYMVDKMNDGRMKLRSMGITEENVEDIKNFLNPRFMQLADWMQDEFLVDKRNEYNEVHKRMFGASMAAIENYFPLKILANARLENVDVADDTTETVLPATSTGSIIKRRRNNLALDVTGANAFSVILDHIQQMERWAAFAEFNRDLNTLLSYKRFRNQVMNMTSAYGGGKTLWNNFRNVCSMAAGAYRPPIAALDKAAVNIAKGVTAAKVSFRVFTALKQFLSMPAYLSDSNPVHLATNLINPVGAWKWSMKNLPLFEKRWNSRMAGDPRLLKSEMDWKMWRSRIVEIASRIGMSPNALVDALTVAIGSHSMYQTKLDKYKRQGYAPDVAEERAKQDATILFNQTQQSSESAFLSTMQVDRSWLSVLFTVFRNSSMSYTRQLYDAIRNIGHRFTPGYKGLTEEFMAKQMRRDGIDPDKADRNAKQEYRRGIIRDLVRVGVFGAAMQFAWNLGAYLPYLILGKDDDEKAKMWDDVMNHTMFGSIEGLTGGDVISAAGQMWANGEGNPEYLAKDMPLASDVLTILKKMDKDQLSAMNDVINLLVQSGIGVNPQTLTDAAVAIIDACGDDAQTSRECALLIARILNCPQSQIDKIYFDELHATGEEASKMSPSEIADRYARYKIRRGAPLTGWAYGDEEREELMEKYRKHSNTIAKERLSRDTDNAISPKMAELLEEYKATQERVSKLNKLKEHDEDRYNELFDELWDTPEYQRYEIIKDYKHDIDDLTKQWFNATTKEERDSCARLLIEAKREMVEQINQVQQ